ncbi:NAD(P)-binding protein [Parathielavia appendiculata]|uniref:NAD(P)-binding protein n=1 Tax=Parathielavia appendiculata TaxID=2587402 RepID=A0AAN6Z1C5_9PEZI|nr:NAD(P)-binding protein [Parathielavia appendiculata]
MVPIKTVAVLGGSRNLGSSIVHELLSAGFTVTGITREASTSSTPTFPDSVPIKKVDYTSFDALKAAFRNQDAVVSVVGVAAAVVDQKIAIDAAAEAGIKRFIPSEFGINTRKLRPLSHSLRKILGDKIAVVNYLEEKAQEVDGFTWTGLSTGLFLDWGLDDSGLGIINLKDKTATVVDSGDEKFQASNLAQVSRAVVGILKHPEATANRYLAMASFNISQNELIAMVEELTKSKLAVTRVRWSDLELAGELKLVAEDGPAAFVDFLRVHTSADGAGNALSEEESANGLIGLPYEDVKSSVESWLRREGAL